MAQRRRWLMAGPWQHPDSGIWWFRKATPADLRNRRDELQALGIVVPREVQRSLRTKDRKEAEKKFHAVSTEVEEEWDRWRTMLEGRPVNLSHKDAVAIAGHDVVAYLAANKAEPEEAQLPHKMVAVTIENIRAHYAHSSLREGQAVFELGQELLKVPPYSLSERLEALLDKEPPGPRRVLASALCGALIRYRETLGWMRAPKLARDLGIRLTKESRIKLADQIASFRLKGWAALKAYHEGDYRKRPFEEEGALPSLPTPTVANTRTPDRLTFNAVIDDQERLSDLRLEKQRKSPATFRKYRTDCAAFANWRGDDKIATVTLLDAENWRDAMLKKVEAGQLTRKTVKVRVTAVHSVLNWAIEHNKQDQKRGVGTGELFPNGNPLSGIDLPKPETTLSEEKTLSKDLARKILESARRETKTSYRWIPWLLAYSGIRIGEAAQLEKRDVLEYEGHWYYLIRDDGEERSTKTHSHRRMPIHRAIVAEGFLKFVEAAPDGQLFPGNRVEKNVREWVHRVTEPYGGLGGLQPNHAWRHLFGDLAIGKINTLASYYLDGRRLPGTKNEYGKSAAMVPELSRMMDEIEPLLPLPQVTPK